MNAIEAIAAERQRQIEVEGYTPKHDDDHEEHVFVRAAAAYALGKPVLDGYGGTPVNLWPWWPNEFKHSDDRRRQLVIAGALIVAAIERLDRASTPHPPEAADAITTLLERERKLTEALEKIKKPGVGAAADWSDEECSEYWAGIVSRNRALARAALTREGE